MATGWMRPAVSAAMNTPDADRTPLKRALVAIEDMRARLAASEAARTEPIAIVGAACRFPGGATDLDSFWTVLAGGVDTITEVPPDRWDAEQYYDPDPSTPGKIVTKAGGFVDSIDGFDAQFFGISPREALTLDPQQRMLLEVCWEAIERAGIAPATLAQTSTGVFVGMGAHEYEGVVGEALDGGSLDFDAYVGTGNAASVAAGRISYVLGLHGPAMAVDTACSSSLVAVHLACQSLRSGESDTALAGGVSLMIRPEAAVYMSELGALSPTGRCRTFAADADGYARGEGCAVLTLKRLSEAVADDDNIMAVIRGSAVNHDGRSGGLTVPNAKAQQAVVRAALANAGADPADVDYVEAHGTGTPIGDPIELRALDAVFRSERSAPLQVGSCKTNIGHLEAAAGIAGLLKVVLALQHDHLPAHLHANELTPHVDWDSVELVVPTETRPWPRPGGARLAGVSSFGLSGTNVHMVVGDGPQAVAEETEAVSERGLHVVPLSARSKQALADLAVATAEVFEGDRQPALADAAFTLGTGRNEFTHRLAIVGSTNESVADGLRRHAAGQSAPEATAGDVSEGPDTKVALLFTGQGSQYVDMGLGLYQADPTFRAAMDSCDEILGPLLGQSILSIMHGPSDPQLVHQTTYTQPALFTLEYALAKMWRRWGVLADAMLGHSIGAYVAAHLAGVFNLEDALAIVAARGRLMGALPTGGAMTAVFADVDVIEAALARSGGSAGIAAINAPDNTVISGPADDVVATVEVLSSTGVQSRSIAASHAFHSVLMEPILDEFRAEFDNIEFGKPRGVRMVSDLTGQPADDTVGSADYWVQHLRQPVRFAPGVDQLKALGCNVFLEAGPGPTLVTLGQRCHPDPELTWVAPLRDGQPDVDKTMRALCQLWTAGVSIDWSSFHRPWRRQRVPLPTARFQRDRHWVPQPGPGALSRSSEATNQLLGTATPTALMHAQFDTTIDAKHPGFIGERTAHGRHELSPPALVESMLAACREALGVTTLVLTDMEILLTPTVGRDRLRCQTIVERTGSSDGIVKVYVAEGQDLTWTIAAQGVVSSMVTPSSEPAVPPLADGDLRPAEVLQDIVEDWAQGGLVLGPKYRCINALWATPGATVARIELPFAADRYVLYPPMLEACVQALSPGSDPQALVGLANVELHSRAPARWCVRQDAAPDALSFYDDDGTLVAHVAGIALEPLNADPLPPRNEWMYELAWQPIEGQADSSGLQGESQQSAAPHQVVVVGTASQADLIRRSSGTAADGAAGTDIVHLDIAEQANDTHVSLVALEDVLNREPQPKTIIYVPTDHVDGATDTAELGLVQSQQLIRFVGRLAEVCWKHKFVEPPRLWLATRGAVATEGAAVDPVSAGLWGLMRAAALELPQFCGGMVDLDPSAPDDPVDLLQVIAQAAGETWLARRDGTTLVGRMDRLTLGQTTGQRLRPDGRYLVTGAFGGIGRAVARWLVDRGARDLLLIARTPLPPRADWSDIAATDPLAPRIDLVRELEAQGASVVVCDVDVADRQALESLLTSIASTSTSPIRGVFHAAGVIRDRSITEMNDDEVADVFAPKVAGAWNLHECLGNEPLEHFVLFSSVAGIFGSAGQANYAAANAFLSGLAQKRRAEGSPALSVDWGAWDVGMADREDLAAARARSGVHAIPVGGGLAVLGDLMDAAVTQATVIPTSAALLGALATTPLFERIIGTRDTSVETADSKWIDHILASEGDERPARMGQYLRNCIADVLGLDPSEVPTTSNVLEVGLDSIMVMEVIQRIGRDLGLVLYPREVFERPSVEALATYCLDELRIMLGHEGEANDSERDRETVLAMPSRGLLPQQEVRNGPAVFLVSTPRAGSTLLRVMLAGSEQLFCPPELHLLPFDTLADRAEELRGSYLDEGLQRAVMELSGLGAEHSQALLAGWQAEGLTVPETYGRLQGLAEGRLLVDKSPSYGLDIDVLRRSEQQFDGARYLHLVRHPYAVVESFAKNRMDRLMGQARSEPYQMGEQVWTTINNNILDFREEIDRDRYCQVRYEDLVRAPEATMRRLAAFLQVEYAPAMLHPYQGDRMTDGVHQASVGIGDPNFHTHQSVDPSLADAWQKASIPRRFDRSSRQLAKELDYELPWPLAGAESVPEQRRPRVEKPPIEVVPGRESAQLSFTEQQLWLAHQLEPLSPQYNMPAATLRLTGPLNVTALEKGINEIVRRHEILRSRFVVEDGEPERVVMEAAPEALTILDLTHLDAEGRETEALRRANAEAKLPFDLAQGPLIRRTLLRLTSDEHLLILIVHHIVSDGWSVGVMMRELTELYEAFSKNEASPLEPLTVQYGDFAAWQRTWLVDDTLDAQLNYWRNQLSGAPPLLDVPTDLARPAFADSTHGARETKSFSTETSRLARAFSQRQAATPFMTLLSALYMTMQRWTGQNDVVIGTVAANRVHEDVEPLIGCFMNFLALRTQLDESDSGAQIVQNVKTMVFDAYDHQDAPYTKVIEAVGPDRRHGSNPLYNVGFLLQNLRSSAPFGDDFVAEHVVLETSSSLLDLRFVAQETSTGLEVTCEYNTDLFRGETVRELLDFFGDVLEQLIEEPERLLADYELPDSLVTQVASRPKKTSIAIAATFTAEPIESSIAFWMSQLQIPAEISFSPYNQVFQELLDPTSQLRRNTDGLNLILLRFEDWQRYATGEDEDFYRETERNADDLVDALKAASVDRSERTLVVICPSSLEDESKTAFLAETAESFATSLSDVSNVDVVLATDVVGTYPVDQMLAPYEDELGHVPYTAGFFTALGSYIARRIDLYDRGPLKVVVLDCDNTIWNGVIGEDGLNGIDVPAAHQRLQQTMKNQISMGRLVCLLSKNNEADVKDVFSEKADMLLSWEDITASRINWAPKHRNIEELASELNLGLDSFLFLDDSPVEVAAMRANHPEVLTLQVPADHSTIPTFLDSIWALDTLALTSEDEQRAQFYEQNNHREQLRESSTTIGDFLSQLEITTSITPVEPEQLDRVAQLTERTNQFNLSGIQRSADELRRLLDDKGYRCLVAEVSDRFGDYGLVGVVILESRPEAMAVDTLLLSCRAMGRGVEHDMIKQAALLADAAGFSQLRVPFAATERNQPALDFLRNISSAPVDAGQIQDVVLDVSTMTGLAYTTAVDAPLLTEEPGRTAAHPLRSAPSERMQTIADTLASVEQISTAIRQTNARWRTTGVIVYEPPRNDLETVVAQIIVEVLNLDKIGIQDNFFEAGGHSLLATGVLGRVAELFKVELSLGDFFNDPTVVGLASLLLQDGAQRQRVQRTAQLQVKLAGLSDDEIAELLANRGARADE